MTTLSEPAANFLASATAMLAHAVDQNTPVIRTLAPILGKVVASGGVIHVFGSGHSEVIAREIIGRAGGLVCITGVQDPTSGFIENLPGYGTRLIERYDRQYELRPGEAIIVISNSGKNCSPIEVAQYATTKGLTVIALTCMGMSRETASQHPSGKRLFEVAHHVLDNGGVTGDAIIPVTDTIKTGPTSTMVGCTLLNLLMIETLAWLKTEGHELPVLRSQNLPGAIEHNRAIGRRYATRLSRPLA